jgi:hypothetical protein
LSAADDCSLPQLPLVLRPYRPLLLCWLLALLDCFSQLLYRSLTRRFAAHPLVRLNRCYDPAAVLHACASYHHHTGPGAKPTYPLALLVRAEIVRVWAGSCSDPQLEQLLASDLIARWYVGLGLFDPSPDHATLNRFHRWLAHNQPRALFADVLAFLDRVDPEDPATTAQIADTFALATPVARCNATDLLLGLSQQLLRLCQLLAPEQLLPALVGIDLSLLHKRPIARTPTVRLAHLRAAAAIATGLQERLVPLLPTLEPKVAAALTAQLDLLGKVLADETRTNATGQVEERPLDQKGSFRLGSPVDVEATYRKHEPDPAVLGYNAAIATTKTRIRAAVLLDGCAPDSQAPVALLEQQKQAGLPLPPALVMDQAGGHGKTRALVESVSAGTTQMVARTPQSGGYDPNRFGPADFQLSADGQMLTCPNGVVSAKAYHSGAADGVHFRFTAKMCQGCPLRGRCREPQSKPNSHRTVYISPYQAHLQRALEFNRSAQGQELLGQRWMVEPTVAWLTRYDGCRRSRRVGKRAATLHLYQACACRNLWRWLERVQRGVAPLPELPKG